MDQNLPSGGEVVIDGPGGLVERVLVVLVGQHHIAVKYLVSTPPAAEQVGDVVEVSTDLEGLLVTSDVEVELLGNLEVDTVEPRGDTAVALGVLASVFAQISFTADILLKFGAILLGGERHGGEFFSRRDVHQLRAVQTAHIVDEVGMAVSRTWSP